jgi:DNA polymerase I-like protein with 3'-5' exonuclease and polymerase domains
LKKILVLDVESTIKANGNPFHVDNRLCLVGLYDGSDSTIYDIEYSCNPYSEKLKEIKARIEEADLLVGFNIKFDLHWIRRYINDISFPAVWDCQLGEFILSRQTSPYPSLDQACGVRGLGSKRDVVALEYWANGIDTDKVPEAVLTDYLRQDLFLTGKLYLEQEKVLRSSALFKLHCSDLKCLQEMEFNGMLYDKEQSLVQGEIYDSKIKLLDRELELLCPVDGINFSSSAHISSVLYGGIVRLPSIVPTSRILKDGTEKRGTKQGFTEVEFPRLVKPLPGTETLPTSKFKSEGDLAYENSKRLREGKLPYIRTYSVDKGVLKSLKATGKAKDIIDILLRRSEMEKLQSTYFRGIPEIMEEQGWQNGILHGQFNQCVARTGRLSSSKPNLQNQSGEVKYLFRSRF